MALERVPADIRREGGVARMTDPKVNISQKNGCVIFLTETVLVITKYYRTKYLISTVSIFT